jgi:hypothetical protein
MWFGTSAGAYRGDGCEKPDQSTMIEEFFRALAAACRNNTQWIMLVKV